MTRASTPAGSRRAARSLQGADLSRRVGRVGDLIGLIIEATGVEAEIGELCMVGEGRDAGAPVRHRGGRLPRRAHAADAAGRASRDRPRHDRSYPTGSPFRVAVGEPLLGRVIDGLGNPLDGFGHARGGSRGGRHDRRATGSVHPPADHRARRPRRARARTPSSRAGAASASASSPARASASRR